MSRHIILTALLLSAITVWANDDNPAPTEAITADKCLKAAPAAIFDMIDQNTLLDMIDYFHAGSTRHSANMLGGECYITADSDHALTMVGGNDIEYQLFVLNPHDQCPIIAVVETLYTPLADSRIRFYDCRWEPLTRLVLAQPTLDQWIKPSSKKYRADIEDQLPFIMAHYSYDPETHTLTMANSMDQYFTASDTPDAMKQIKSTLTYTWDGKKFKLNK